MATPHTRPNGQVIDLDDYTPTSDREALELVQEILDRTEAEDAVHWETDPGYQVERIQRVLWSMGFHSAAEESAEEEG